MLNCYSKVREKDLQVAGSIFNRILQHDIFSHSQVLGTKVTYGVSVLMAPPINGFASIRGRGGLKIASSFYTETKTPKASNSTVVWAKGGIIDPQDKTIRKIATLTRLAPIRFGIIRSLRFVLSAGPLVGPQGCEGYLI